MKRFGFRYIWIPALCILLLLTGCSLFRKTNDSDRDTEQIRQELEDLKQQLNAAKTELETLKNAENTTGNTVVSSSSEQATPEPATQFVDVPVEFIVAENCTINGEKRVRLEGNTEIHAVADTIEGYVFDHWVYQGKEDRTSGPEADFVISEPTAVCAAFRRRCILTFKDCHMTLLDRKGNSVGKSYTTFDFEDAYKNPETKENKAGGSIDFYVFADVPSGMEVDYWIINGVHYVMLYNNISKFRVEDMTEATDYEVVFRKAKSKPRTPTDRE